MSNNGFITIETYFVDLSHLLQLLVCGEVRAWVVARVRRIDFLVHPWRVGRERRTMKIEAAEDENNQTEEIQQLIETDKTTDKK